MERIFSIGMGVFRDVIEDQEDINVYLEHGWRVKNVFPFASDKNKQKFAIIVLEGEYD